MIDNLTATPNNITKIKGEFIVSHPRQPIGSYEEKLVEHTRLKQILTEISLQIALNNLSKKEGAPYQNEQKMLVYKLMEVSKAFRAVTDHLLI